MRKRRFYQYFVEVKDLQNLLELRGTMTRRIER